MSNLGEHSPGVNITWTDQGSHWRATNSASRIDSSTVQVLDHVSPGGSKSGIRYAIGPDELTAQVNILWVDWPKSIFSLEELQDSPQSSKFFAGCNVCSALNQMSPSVPASSVPVVSSSLPVVPADVASGPVRSRPYVSTESPPARLSAGDLVLPKYIPVALNLAKSIWLNPLGNAVVSLVSAFGADVLSGLFEDPAYKKAWQCVSDEMIDGVSSCMTDPAYVDRVKRDISVVVESYQKDNDFLSAMSKGMVRPMSDLLKKSHGSGVRPVHHVNKLYSASVD